MVRVSDIKIFYSRSYRHCSIQEVGRQSVYLTHGANMLRQHVRELWVRGKLLSHARTPCFDDGLSL